MSVLRATAILALLAGFVVVCDDPLNPESTSVGLYDLIMLEGVPVPGILEQSGDATLDLPDDSLWIPLLAH